MIGELLFGAVVGALFVLLARTQNRRRELATYAAGVVIAAALYVGFATLRHGLSHLPLELLGLAVFSIAAVAGLRGSPALIGMAWVAHGAWDAILHSPPPPYVPSWYPLWCLGFDCVVGFYVLASRRAFGGLE
jgi:hypothetical protein